METLFRLLAAFFLLCLLTGCAANEAETSEVGEAYAHFHMNGTVFFLDNTVGSVTVVPNHFRPMGQLLLSDKEDDFCGNVEGTLLMSETFPDFAYVELPDSEEDIRSYSVFRAEDTVPIQDHPAFSVTFSGGLDILLTEADAADQIFDIVILPEYSRTWNCEKEADRLSALGYDVQMEGSILRGRVTGQQLAEFPAMHYVCLYEIMPAIVYDSISDAELLSLRDETGCRDFLEEQGIVIPEEYDQDLQIRGFILDAEMDPHTAAGISDPVIFDLSEAVRRAVLEYHGLPADSVTEPEEMPITYTEEWLECTELYRQALDALPDALSLNWCPYDSVSLLDLDFNGIPELLLYDPSFDFVTICTVENGTVCRFNITPVLNGMQLAAPPSANAIELEMGSICLNRPLEEQDMKNWNTPDIRPIVQYTDTETGEPVYLSISWDRAEAPAGYDPISYYTSTTTVMRFYCRDGLLAAETLASWSHIGSIDDLHFYTPITDEAVQSAEFAEINARYIPIPGIDYGRAVRDAALEDHLPTAGFLSPTPAVETEPGMPEPYIPENTAD